MGREHCSIPDRQGKGSIAGKPDIIQAISRDLVEPDPAKNGRRCMKRTGITEKNFLAGFGRYLKVASSGGLGPACFQAGRQPMD
jgi:hypothetical protein